MAFLTALSRRNLAKRVSRRWRSLALTMASKSFLDDCCPVFISPQNSATCFNSVSHAAA